MYLESERLVLTGALADRNKLDALLAEKLYQADASGEPAHIHFMAKRREERDRQAREIVVVAYGHTMTNSCVLVQEVSTAKNFYLKFGAPSFFDYPIYKEPSL